MKKTLCLIMVVLLCLSLVACGKKDDKKEESLPSTVPTIEPTVTPEPKMIKVAVIKDADSGLNVRASASTEGEVLGLAENGDTFKLMSTNADSGWYQVQYDGRNAFIYADFVTVKDMPEDEAEKKFGGNKDETSSKPDSDTSDVSSETSSSSKTDLPTKDNEDGES